MQKSQDQKTATLNDLLNSWQKIQLTIVERLGEIDPLTDELLINLEEEIATKIDKYGFMIERFEHEAELYKEKAERYTKLKQANAKYAEYMREKIKGFLLTTNQNELQGSDYKVSIRNSTPKYVYDLTKLPSFYKQIEEHANAALIKLELKEGKVIPGVEKIETKAMTLKGI